MKAKKWVLWVIVGATCLCVLPCGFGIFAYRLSPYGQGADIVRDEQAKAKKLGMLTSLSEVPNWIPRIADADNSAPLVKSFSALRRQDVESWIALDKSPGLGLGKQIDWEAIEELLRKLAPAVKLAETMASKKGFYANRDWTLGYSVLFPEFAQLKSASKLLAWSAALKAKKGNRPDAIRGLKSILRIARQARSEPTLIAFLVAESVESILWNALQEMMLFGPLKAADRSAISELVATPIPPADYTRAACVELLLADSGLMSSKVVPGDETPSKALKQVFKYPFIRDANRSVLWKEGMALQGILRSPEKTPIQKATAAADMYQKLEARKDLAAIFARVAHIDFSRPLLADLRGIVRRDILTSLAAGKERSMTAVDPFSGWPYQNLKFDGELLIYSVGINLKDDGGVLHVEPNQPGTREVDYGMKIKLN